MKIFSKIEEYLCILCLIIMTVLTFGNVVSRYLLHASMSFSDEITTYLFVLLSMMGTAIAAKRRAHLGLTILTDAVSPQTRKYLTVTGFAIGTVFSLALFYYGIQMVLSQYRLGQVTAAMQWPEWIYGMFIPFGAFFITVRFAQATWEEARASGKTQFTASDDVAAHFIQTATSGDAYASEGHDSDNVIDDDVFDEVDEDGGAKK